MTNLQMRNKRKDFRDSELFSLLQEGRVQEFFDELNIQEVKSRKQLIPQLQARSKRRLKSGFALEFHNGLILTI